MAKKLYQMLVQVVLRSRNHAFSITTITTTIGLVCSLIAGIIQARVLGSEGRGEFAAIQNWAAFFAIYGHLGLANANTFYIKRLPDQTNLFVAKAIKFSIIMTILLFPIAYIATPFALSAQESNIIGAAQVYLLYFPMQFLVLVCYTTFQGQQKHLLWNSIRMTYPISMAIGALIIFTQFWLGFKPNATTLSYSTIGIMSLFTTVSVLILWQHIYLPNLFLPINLPIPHKEYFTRSLTIVATTGPRGLNLRFDQMVMAAVIAPQDLGYYVIAANWSYMALHIVLSIGYVAIAQLAAIHDEQRLATEISRIFKRALIIDILCGIIALIITPFFIPLLFGNEYQKVVNISLILIFAAFFSVLNGVSADIFQGIGKPKYALIAELSGLCIAIPGIFIVLPNWGIWGAAWLSMGVYIFIHIVEVFFLVSINRNLSIGHLYPTVQDFNLLIKSCWQVKIQNLSHQQKA